MVCAQINGQEKKFMATDAESCEL